MHGEASNKSTNLVAGEITRMEFLIMLDLLKQKNILLTQLHHCANNFGLTHPRTVKKSQELDVIVNKIVFQDIEMQKKAG